jgi:hypothetical protein
MQARCLLVPGRARCRAELATQARPYGLFFGRDGKAPKMVRRATPRPGTMRCSMEARSSGCCRRSVRGVHHRRDLVAYPWVGNPPTPDLSSRGVPAELAATGSRDGGGTERRAGGCGRRGLWSKAVARGGRGCGLAGWRLGAGRSVWGATELEGVGGEEEGAVGASSVAGEKRREGEVWERGGVGRLGGS